MELPSRAELKAISLQLISESTFLERENAGLKASLSSCRSTLWAEVRKAAVVQRENAELRREIEELCSSITTSALHSATLDAIPSTGAEPGGATVAVVNWINPPSPIASPGAEPSGATTVNWINPTSPIASPPPPSIRFFTDDDAEMLQVMAPSAMFVGLKSEEMD